LQKIQELADSVNANIKQAEQRRNVEDLIEGIPGIAVSWFHTYQLTSSRLIWLLTESYCFKDLCPLVL
jgi:hypothetical protein